MRRFLSLPAALYPKGELTQNKSAERALLRGTHVLSRYFSVYPIIATDGASRTAARCAVTIYPDREDAYFGFFESIDDQAAARAVLTLAEKVAARHGKRALTGPVDCSFWIKYRLKTDRFGKPYTGEPYNLPYYERLLTGCGYSVSEEYFSNHYGVIPPDDRNPKNEKRLADMTAKGFKILSPDKHDLDRVLDEVYDMLIQLYSDFPIYSHITREEFTELFSPLKRAVDRSMMRTAYLDGKPAGFFVTVPDYGTAACGRLTPRKLMDILRTKRSPDSFVMLYMGGTRGSAQPSPSRSSSSSPATVPGHTAR